MPCFQNVTLVSVFDTQLRSWRGQLPAALVLCTISRYDESRVTLRSNISPRSCMSAVRTGAYSPSVRPCRAVTRKARQGKKRAPTSARPFTPTSSRALRAARSFPLESALKRFRCPHESEFPHLTACEVVGLGEWQKASGAVCENEPGQPLQHSACLGEKSGGYRVRDELDVAQKGEMSYGRKE